MKITIFVIRQTVKRVLFIHFIYGVNCLLTKLFLNVSLNETRLPIINPFPKGVKTTTTAVCVKCNFSKWTLIICRRVILFFKFFFIVYIEMNEIKKTNANVTLNAPPGHYFIFLRFNAFKWFFLE